MRFDDRLLTVLSQPAGDRHDIAVRWRQLVDLVARAGSNAASPPVAQAIDSIRADASLVDENLRAAAARAVAAFPLPLGLLEYFASDRLAVSSAVLAAATLEQAQWRALLGVADHETRRFIETLHPEVSLDVRAVPLDGLEPESPDSDLSTSNAAPSLHDVVERIERRRRSRSSMQRAAGMAAGAEGAHALFRWECGPGGEIAWVDGAPRGPLIGRSIARPQDVGGDRLDPEVVRAFMLRAPFRDATLSLGGDGVLSGDWRISGVPAFEPADGRFAGYRGVALREQEEAVSAHPAEGSLSDPDSLRELVHEIKTPLTAIIGFAEIIEGQYLGPADQRYRERAQEIVSQARLLLTAIDDLDFAAKVQSSAASVPPRAQLCELVEQVAPQLREIAAGRGVDLQVARSVREASAETEGELADRLIFRLCSALIEQAGAGETLRLGIDPAGDRWSVSMTRPEGLQHLSEEQLLEGASLDEGFRIRLVRGLARIAGVDVAAPKESISLLFPRA